MPHPRFTPGQPTQRFFIGRESYLRLFDDAVARRKEREQVLIFYGVGGIGKTSLRKHLAERLREQYPGAICHAIDFTQSNYRQPQNALAHLRKCLSQENHIRFLEFDIAFAAYWQKAYPQIQLTSQEFPLLEEGSIIAELIAGGSNLPILSHLSNGVKLVTRLSSRWKDWWAKQERDHLTELTRLEAHEIEDRLPMYFASDLKDNIDDWTAPVVLLLDTYEALWEPKKNEHATPDAWVQELISHLPQVLWVICGRERLRWTETDNSWAHLLMQHRLDQLSEPEARQFLNVAGVKETEIQDALINGSHGVPYYLELAAHTARRIHLQEAREPHPTDFGHTPNEVHDRFMKYLDRTERAMLEALAAPRFWTNSLLVHLASTLQTGYPAHRPAELLRFSFIQKTPAGDAWSMHELMRQSLLERTESATQRKYHRACFDYYQDQLKTVDNKTITSQNQTALTEALYHGSQIYPPTELKYWFDRTVKPFWEGCYFQFLTPLYTQLLEHLEADLSLRWRIRHVLGRLYLYRARYNQACEILHHALSDAKAFHGPDKPEVPYVWGDLGECYARQRQYSKADDAFQRALAVLRKHLGNQHEETALMLRRYYEAIGSTWSGERAVEILQDAVNILSETLGSGHQETLHTKTLLTKLYGRMGDHQFAISVLKECLLVQETANPESHDVVNTLAGISNGCHSAGQLEEALVYSERAVELAIKLNGNQHAVTVSIQCQLLSLYAQTERLADVRKLLTHVKESIHAFDEIPPICTDVILDGLYSTTSVLFSFDLPLAEESVRLELATMDKAGDVDHGRTREALYRLGAFLMAQGKTKEAHAIQCQLSKHPPA